MPGTTFSRRRIRLAPSILSADHARLAEAVQAVERAGADWVHVDVMDGHYVPNLTFGPKMVADLRRATALPLDVHLMIERPERWVERYADSGASCLTIHVESAADVSGTLAAIRGRGLRAGVTCDPDTPIERLFPHLGEVDLALVMSVRPGFGGQSFLAGSLERVGLVRAELDRRELAADLEIDGGVKVENCRAIREAGADVLVAGSGVFLDPEGVAAALSRFRRELGQP